MFPASTSPALSVVPSSSAAVAGRVGSPRQLPAALRPREKLLAHGACALADTELLALVLRTGPRGEGVFGLAQRLLDRFDGLAGLLQAPPQALRACAGLAPLHQAGLLAVMELARRVLAQQLREQALLDAPQKAKDFVALRLSALPHEVFAVIFLDAQHRLLEYEEMFHGTLTQTSVYPREVVRRALGHNAAAVVLAHNHPSGVAEPSRADELLTASLRAALALVDVRVLDHLVVGRGTVVSMAERGLL